jgi:UPF0176 protein
VTLLDTRNDYEMKLGTFKGAIDPQIKTFRGFPDAVRKLPDELKTQPVVMFCTGGIRCEKAGPFMELEGFQNIYQLDGGILKYFEECGGDHYEGDCFVFDQRVGVDPALHESGHAVCFACLAPLDATDQQDPRYVQGKSCPHCHKSEPELLAGRIAARQEAVRRACEPLPGSVAQENRRPVNIPAAHDKRRMLDVLIDLFPQIPAAEWEARCDAGRFINYGGDIRGKDHIVRAGERVLQVFAPEAEPRVSTDIRILYEDEALLVVHKPAPLPMHAGGRFHRNTLQYILNIACEPFPPRPVHRLDANTTGVVLFARNPWIYRQFATGVLEQGCQIAARVAQAAVRAQEPEPAHVLRLARRAVLLGLRVLRLVAVELPMDEQRQFHRESNAHGAVPPVDDSASLASASGLPISPMNTASLPKVGLGRM